MQNININPSSPKDTMQSPSSRKDQTKNTTSLKPKAPSGSPTASTELCTTLDLHQPKSWEFQNFSTDPRTSKKRPQEDPSPLDRPKRKSPSRLPAQSPDTTPHTSFIMVPENNPPASVHAQGKSAEMEMLYQEIRKLKNQNMAMKWENGELKCENTRYKMYNQELATAHQVLIKEQEKVKQDLEERIEKLESEKKVLQALADKIPKNVAPWDYFTPTPESPSTSSSSWHPIKKHTNPLKSAISNLID